MSRIDLSKVLIVINESYGTVANPHAVYGSAAEDLADYYISARGLSSSNKLIVPFGICDPVYGQVPNRDNPFNSDIDTLFTNVFVPIANEIEARGIQCVIGCYIPPYTLSRSDDDGVKYGSTIINTARPDGRYASTINSLRNPTGIGVIERGAYYGCSTAGLMGQALYMRDTLGRMPSRATEAGNHGVNNSDLLAMDGIDGFYSWQERELPRTGASNTDPAQAQPGFNMIGHPKIDSLDTLRDTYGVIAHGSIGCPPDLYDSKNAVDADPSTADKRQAIFDARARSIIDDAIAYEGVTGEVHVGLYDRTVETGGGVDSTFLATPQGLRIIEQCKAANVSYKNYQGAYINACNWGKDGEQATPAPDYSHTDMIAGTLTPETAWGMIGTAILNESVDGAYTSSYVWGNGSWGIEGTSFTVRLGVNMMRYGGGVACLGTVVEPFFYALGHIDTSFRLLVEGKTMAEAMLLSRWNPMYNNAFGDPLYKPFYKGYIL